MAILNEFVWRTQTTEFWVNYKVFGAIGVTLIFTMTQIPLITRYQALPKESGAEKGEREKDGG
jgi:intracellular septation protein